MEFRLKLFITRDLRLLFPLKMKKLPDNRVKIIFIRKNVINFIFNEL